MGYTGRRSSLPPPRSGDGVAAALAEVAALAEAAALALAAGATSGALSLHEAAPREPPQASMATVKPRRSAFPVFMGAHPTGPSRGCNRRGGSRVGPSDANAPNPPEPPARGREPPRPLRDGPHGVWKGAGDDHG